METCDNCGRTIGRLETPEIWDDHLVCRMCLDHLEYETTESEAPDQPSRSLSAASRAICILVATVGMLMSAFFVLIGVVELSRKQYGTGAIGLSLALSLGHCSWLLFRRRLSSV